jgi:molybdopterin adenylyltransferase
VRAQVLTISDRAAAGTREDQSGPAIRELLVEAGFQVTGLEVVPDEVDQIASYLILASAAGPLVVTTGGTGLGPRDVTPEATRSVIDYEVPGLAELMRSAGCRTTLRAALSRSVAGVRARSLIVNLPGSVKGAVESLRAILPVLDHACQMLEGDTEHR